MALNLYNQAYMEQYDPKAIEPKWQQYWLENKTFAADDASGKEKKYVLDMFPYPSGDGLHVGHVKIYTASDVVARYWRMRGFEVLHPTGWDAFGLPTENTAIKKGIHPEVLTKQNVEGFRGQMRRMGFSYDWSREVNTTDPEYYKWTQWIFIQLFKKGLAYEATVPINWCPSCKTGLANEEVVDGKCERCGTEVEEKPMRQWMLKITAYADRLLGGLEGLDWPKHIKDLQANWIGRKEGIHITYKVKDSAEEIVCFTTRPDTNFGATFVVVAPEHPLAQKVAQENEEVAAYVEQATKKTERQRLEEEKKKTGVFTGLYVVNTLNGRELPVWVSDFVLGHFGTGAVVGVPGHDRRDFEFAREFDLPIERVVVAPDGDTSPIESVEQVQESAGVMVNSEFLDGMDIEEATERMMDYMEKEGYGERVVNYSLRDWVFSRQRYWGEPIPLIHCEQCGVVPVPEEQLPVTLPEVERYEPTGTGESPLAAIEEWVYVDCPECGGQGKRETNTMPQWAGSSWYWLRYVSPQYGEGFADSEALKQWLPVDLYVGGAEHAVLHLMYARFWQMVLFDQELVPQAEPFEKFAAVGLVLGEDNQKMSKSRGNVVNPDDVVNEVGADALRVYEMFMGPFEGSVAWDTNGINGARRFLDRVWALVLARSEKPAEEVSAEVDLKVQQTIRQVTEDTEHMKFNTAIAAMMELINLLEKQLFVRAETLEALVLLLSPYAPHVAEELWQRLGKKEALDTASWPVWSQDVLDAAAVTIPVQVNGRRRGELQIGSGASQTEVEARARELENVQRHLAVGDVVKVIFVPDRMVNFVVK